MALLATYRCSGDRGNSNGTLMKKFADNVIWVEGIIVNTKNLVGSLGNVAVIFHEHLIFGLIGAT